MTVFHVQKGERFWYRLSPSWLRRDVLNRHVTCCIAGQRRSLSVQDGRPLRACLRQPRRGGEGGMRGPARVTVSQAAAGEIVVLRCLFFGGRDSVDV